MDRENYWKGRSPATEIDSCVNVHLVPGDIICPKCGGKGIYPVELDDIRERCDKCWREGKLDWIEMAMGKEDPYAGYSTSSSSISQSSYTAVRHNWEDDVESPLDKYTDLFAEKLKEAVDRDIMEMLKNVFGTKYKKEKEAYF